MVKLIDGGEMTAMLDEHAKLFAENKVLRAALEAVRELANWHSDDDADEADTSPDDMTAHINGLIRRKCNTALTPKYY